MSPSTVSTAFVRSALRSLDAGQQLELLAEAGIATERAAQAGARVPAAAFGRLWLLVARRLDDEFFGLDSRRMKVGSFAMICHALAGQSSVGDALRLALRGFGLYFDDIAASLHVVGGGQAVIRLSNRIAPAWAADDAEALADARRFADETLLVMLHGLLCWLVGRRVAVTRLAWAHPQPAHAEEYRRMFTPLLHFDAAATELAFDARLLAAVVAVDATSLKAFLREAPQSVFLKQVAGSGTSERVRRLCRQVLQRGAAPPTLPDLARELGQSAATLRRRLAAEGASWQRLKDAERRTLAIEQLSAGSATVAEVAERLGFEDASTFYRAFRKWTGQAPGAWRRGSGG